VAGGIVAPALIAGGVLSIMIVLEVLASTLPALSAACKLNFVVPSAVIVIAALLSSTVVSVNVWATLTGIAAPFQTRRPRLLPC
jgi:hypothetical protein